MMNYFSPFTTRLFYVWFALKGIKNSYIFFCDRLHFFDGKILSYTFWNGRRMSVRAGTTDTIETLVMFSDLEYPKKFFLHNAVVLDVGANIGAFSIYYANEVGNDCKIFAIEPSLENRFLLEQNVQQNSLQNNISCHRFAFSNADGFATLDISKTVNAFTLLRENLFSEKTECVPVVTIETFCVKNKISVIDILKIDIEGGEYVVFQHSMPFIKGHTKWIYLEVHDLDDKHHLQQLKQTLLTNGFVLVQTIKTHTLLLRNSVWT